MVPVQGFCSPQQSAGSCLVFVPATAERHPFGIVAERCILAAESRSRVR